MKIYLGRHGAGANAPFFTNVVTEQKTSQVLRDELLTWCELVPQGEIHPITRTAYVG